MTDQQHPITPPPPQDRLKRWEDDILNERENVDVVLDCTWKDAYRAGADTELEACCKALEDIWDRSYYDMTIVDILHELRAARRPNKPPSLAEEALAELDLSCGRGYIKEAASDTIRAALKRLQELEQGNG